MASIYDLGKYMPSFSIAKADQKLRFILYPYTSKEIIGTSLLFLLGFSFLAILLWPISDFFLYALFFLGIISAISLYIYPTSIYYTKQIIDYREEMLRALMKMATYVMLNSSLEYAALQTMKELRGTLRLQFEDIFEQIRLKKKNTFGDAIEDYIGTWNEVNSEFVKGLKLLITASMSSKIEKEEIIGEAIETIIRSYYNSGKRFAEDLAGNAKMLVAGGVLLPIISLMILPLVSIFLPQIVKAPLLAFIYNIFFPTILLLMALHFSASRVQVNTIRLEDSPQYEGVPKWLYILSGLVMVVFSIPTILHISSIDMAIRETAVREYALSSVILVGSVAVGIVIGIYFFTKHYIAKYDSLWDEVYQTEQDFPYLLQIFSTYLSLNRSIESIVPEIIHDYETHGNKDHPIVALFQTLKKKLQTTKKTILELSEKILPKICPSEKVSTTITQIISFSDVSQQGAARAAKMMRKQTLSIYQLDDYIKSILSETVSLINITITMLAPLLSAAAVVMSLAIVMSLTFISDQLESLTNALGGTEGPQLALVDITKIIPPTIIEVIVSIYMIEMIIILSIFISNIKIGNDRFQLMKTLHSNIIIGSLIYATLLVGGFMVFKATVFKGVIM